MTLATLAREGIIYCYIIDIDNGFGYIIGPQHNNKIKTSIATVRSHWTKFYQNGFEEISHDDIIEGTEVDGVLEKAGFVIDYVYYDHAGEPSIIAREIRGGPR
tara:strand:- start:1470 stop:1778 length:309 start_codon:yes stop_codon:yes gene_type:complete